MRIGETSAGRSRGRAAQRRWATATMSNILYTVYYIHYTEYCIPRTCTWCFIQEAGDSDDEDDALARLLAAQASRPRDAGGSRGDSVSAEASTESTYPLHLVLCAVYFYANNFGSYGWRQACRDRLSHPSLVCHCHNCNWCMRISYQANKLENFQ